MNPPEKKPSRKKFLLWASTLLASVTALKFAGHSKSKKTETVKMLAQDGTLVEIDKALLVSSGRKITNKELQHWVQKEKRLNN